MTVRVGLISDTHGLLRPEAMAFLAGSDHIVHAGDVGDEDVLDALAAIAPLTVVRGNVDTAPWTSRLPETATVTIAGVTMHVLHDLNALAIDPRAAKVHVVVSGHSHTPLVTERHGVRYVNPGSAGPRRFRLPISIAELTIDGPAIAIRLHELAVGA